MKTTLIYYLHLCALWSSHKDVCGHGDAVIPREPVLDGELVTRIAHDFVEATQVEHPLAGKDIHAISGHDSYWSLIRARVARRDAPSRGNGVGTFSGADIHIHIGSQAGGRIADQDPICHRDVVIPGEPVLGRQLIARITHHFVEAISIQ